MNAIRHFIATPHMIVALVVAVLAVGATYKSAWSEGGKEQATLILSNLPAKQSAEYKALSDLAGQAKSQDLDMMKSEKWSVPRERLEAFLAAAAEKGVRVTRLDDDWNRVFEPMSQSEPMSDKQKTMMKKAMESEAAMGASMMKAPPQDVLDYALTKDIQEEEHEAPLSLVIPLKDNTAVTVRRTSVTKRANSYVWHGVVEGTGEPVTLLCYPGGRLAGTINYKGRTYVVKYMGGQMHAVVEYAPDKMPDEHCPASKDMMQKMNMRTDPLIHQGDASMLMPDAEPTRSMTMIPTDRAEDAKIALVVAYTKNAASHYFDIDKDLIEVAVAEANQSFRTSKIDNVQIDVVHTYETDYDEEGSHFDHVFRFRDKGDGYMDEVHALRDKYGADVGILVVDDPNGCGLSIRIAAEEKDAFAALHHNCAATMYTLGHEIGHLIGARHDRALDNTSQPFRMVTDL